METLISIIVPVYNVEQYLDRCINSIVRQTYKAIEIILVDDGSTDGSGHLCEQWKKRDERIIVIHKQNGGLSDARNSGIKIACGEYICFVDSDDFIDERFVELLFTLATTARVNIAAIGMVMYAQEQDLVHDTYIQEKTEILDRNKALSCLLT